jgi:hypothetical protein
MTGALSARPVPVPFAKSVSGLERVGRRPDVEVGMERIRIDRKRVKPRPRPKILPLDPRDPDILRAKAIQARYLPPRRRAA